VAAAATAGGAVALLIDAAYLWLPLRPHWLLFAGVLHLTAVFPGVHRIEARWRNTLARSAPVWAIGIVATTAWLLADLLSPPAWSQIALWVSTLAIVPVALLTAANLRNRYRAAAPGERGRVLGIVAAVIVCVLGELVYHVTSAMLAGRPPAIVAAVHLAAPMIAILLVGYAVFVRGGLSPQLVVRRTALYGALGVVGIFFVALLDQLLSSLLVTQLGISEGFVSSMMLAVVAVLLKPVHDRLSGWLTRTIAQRMPETAGDDALSAIDDAIPAPGVAAGCATASSGGRRRFS
jgi:hypothetical protein